MPQPSNNMSLHEAFDSIEEPEFKSARTSEVSDRERREEIVGELTETVDSGEEADETWTAVSADSSTASDLGTGIVCDSSASVDSLTSPARKEPGGDSIYHELVSLRNTIQELRAEIERLKNVSDANKIMLIQTLNHSCVWEHDFFEIPLDLATAAFDVKDKIVLHRRPAVKELYQRLNAPGLALVKGSPGSGKSTCMFALALGLVGQHEESAILWVKIEALQFMVIKRSGIDQYELPSDSWDPLISMMNSGSMSFSGIFVDQCRLNHQKTSDDAKLLRIFFNNWMKKDGCERLYAITSDGCNDYRGTGFNRKDVIELKSWTLEEYLVVLKHKHALGKFAKSLGLPSVPMDDEVGQKARLKLYYAGISARLFFEYTIEEIEGLIDMSIQQVSSFDALHRGDIGSGSPHAVNTLFNDHNDAFCFNSRFIADCLIEKNKILPETFTNMLSKLGYRPHRGGVGVLFELYTLCLMNRSGWNPIDVLRSERETNCPYTFPPTIPTVVSRRIAWYEEASSSEIPLGGWFKPLNSYNPGFDTFHLFGTPLDGGDKLRELVIIFVQVTCGKKHGFNPQHFARAATMISQRVQGFVPAPSNASITRSQTEQGSQNHTKVFIEIVFAVPTGGADTFVVNELDVLTWLENIDDRWSTNIMMITQVPHSAPYFEDDILSA